MVQRYINLYIHIQVQIQKKARMLAPRWKNKNKYKMNS